MEGFGWRSGCEALLHGSGYRALGTVWSKSQQINLGHFRCHLAVRQTTFTVTSRHVRHMEHQILSSPSF